MNPQNNPKIRLLTYRPFSSATVRILLACCLVQLVGQPLALAELTVLHSRVEFEAAVPTALAIEDFTAIAPGTVLSGMDVPLLLGVDSGITVSASGSSPQTVDQFSFAEVGIDNPAVQGNFLSGRAEADAGDSILLRFLHIPHRHHAVGFDYSGATGGLSVLGGARFQYRVTTANGTRIATVFPQDDGFIGFFDPVCPIISIEFFDAAEPDGLAFGEGWGLDNLTVSLEALPDTDGDGMPDLYEDETPGLERGVADGGGDLDGDTLTNVEEFELCTNPNLTDSDGDGFLDNEESKSGIYFSPANPGTDPALADTDGDGYPDNVETNTGLFVDINNTGTDPNNADTDADDLVDAIDPDSRTPPRADLVHLYEFESGLGDTLGGPDITANGGVVGGGEYSFGLNQGLTLDTGVELASNYSIGLRFTFANSIAGFKKLIDFKDRESDAGVYSIDQSVGFLGIGGSVDAVIFPNTVIEFVVVRDELTKMFHGYINGSPIPQFSLVDPVGLSFAHNPGTAARFHFFMDDVVSTFSEAFSGTVDEIRFWDGPLSAEDIPSAFQVIAPPVLITDVSVAMGAGNDVTVAVSWNSTPGQTYSIDFSSDLQTWLNLSDTVGSQGNETTYEDRSQAVLNLERGYYRVRQN